MFMRSYSKQLLIRSRF